MASFGSCSDEESGRACSGRLFTILDFEYSHLHLFHRTRPVGEQLGIRNGLSRRPDGERRFWWTRLDCAESGPGEYEGRGLSAPRNLFRKQDSAVGLALTLFQAELQAG